VEPHVPARSALAIALAAALSPLVLPSVASAASTRVLVRERAPATATAERLVSRLGGHVTRRLPLLGGFSATLPAGRVAALRRSPAVRSVTADAVLRPQTVAACDPTTAVCSGDGFERAWQSAIRLDLAGGRFDGAGVGVALLDTGVTPSPDLGGRLLARVDLTSEGDGLDHYGHGTHMEGLIAGDATQLAHTEGSAPEARLVSIKVAGWDGATDVSSVIAGLQWAVANRDRYGLRVVNLSYGTDAVQPADRDPLDYAVERAWQAGLAVVVSAGNDPTTISKPGDDPFVITVGAADVHGTAVASDDTLAPFSGRADGKPDVLAPGISLRSLRAPGSTVDALNPSARVGDVYFKGSGTSQAAAIVSGVLARMFQANPALTPDQAKAALVATANPTLAGPGAGAGLIDANAALVLVGPRRGAVGSDGLPRANAGTAASSGLGTIDGSRGSERGVADLNGDGIPEPLSGEVDVLGRPWDAAAYAADPWTAASFAASPWAAIANVIGIGAAPRLAPGPRVAWEARHWGAADWVAAGWDPETWAARHWGARHWGSVGWQ
jgi:serine protease AprX